MDLFNLKLANQLKLQLGSFSPVGQPTQLSTLSRDYLDFYQLPLPNGQYSVSLGTYDIKQQSIFCASWRPTHATATALIVHGYMDHLGLYNHLINFLLSKILLWFVLIFPVMDYPRVSLVILTTLLNIQLCLKTY